MGLADVHCTFVGLNLGGKQLKIFFDGMQYILMIPVCILDGGVNQHTS